MSAQPWRGRMIPYRHAFPKLNLLLALLNLCILIEALAFTLTDPLDQTLPRQLFQETVSVHCCWLEACCMHDETVRLSGWAATSLRNNLRDVQFVHYYEAPPHSAVVAWLPGCRHREQLCQPYPVKLYTTRALRKLITFDHHET
jgi:hypothetical protein